MNYRVLAYLLGLLTLCLGALMLPSVAVGWISGDSAAAILALLEAIGATLLLGGALLALGWRGRRSDIFRREALATVGVGWLLAAGVSALPFFLSGESQFARYTDCYFEAMSGLTTTGSTILTQIEILPRGLLFWRSFLHWLGGMGIIVLFIAVLPLLGVGGKALFRSEVPGPINEGLTPRIKQTAMILWKIYLGLTVAETLALLLCGMNWFDALCHTFGTLATGGFSTRNASIAAFNSPAVEAVIIVFMVIAGANFSLHFQALRGRPGAYARDSEFRLYIGILALAALILTLNLAFVQQVGIARALRDASFTAVSIMTTTGYGTADFEQWTAGSKAILLLLMFIGGCGGSTGGGLKVIRWLVLGKIALAQVEKAFRPRAVRRVKVSGAAVDEAVQRGILTYFFLAILIVILATIALALLMPGESLLTAASAVIATFNNIGPGLDTVGPTLHFAPIHPVGKWILSLCMVMGRLELLAILTLFLPGFWSKR